MPLEMQIRYYALDYTRASKSKGQGLAQGQGLAGGQWSAPAASSAYPESTDKTGQRASSGARRGVGVGAVDQDGDAGGGSVAEGGFGQGGVGQRARRSNRMGDVGPEWATLER